MTRPIRGGKPTAASTEPLPRNTILLGDAGERLARLPDCSVDTIITSPPYYGVRDYGHERQLGAESDVDSWVSSLREVARQLARVLRPTGSLWLNLGDSYSRRPAEGAPIKSLLLGPARLALALVRDGWTLRNQVIWAKSNPMPSSVTDRLSTAHELIYFFTRSRNYYFNLNAIRRPLTTTRRQTTSNPQASYPPPGAGGVSREGWTLNDNRGLSMLKVAGVAGHPLGKNPGDVWTLPTAGFRGGHFATFPLSLVERPLLATCPERVCTTCGLPWEHGLVWSAGRLLAVGELQPNCQCEVESQVGMVLDPFMGTGTTALAAEKHGRDWLGVELNASYVAMAEDRLNGARVARRKPGKGRISSAARASPENDPRPA